MRITNTLLRIIAAAAVAAATCAHAQTQVYGTINSRSNVVVQGGTQTYSTQAGTIFYGPDGQVIGQSGGLQAYPNAGGYPVYPAYPSYNGGGYPVYNGGPTQYVPVPVPPPQTRQPYGPDVVPGWGGLPQPNYGAQQQVPQNRGGYYYRGR